MFAEKLNRRDRKGLVDIEICDQRKTPPEFWQALHNSDKPAKVVEHLPLDIKSSRCILYKIKVGMGSMELPQVEVKGALTNTILNSQYVYILDCKSDLFLWMGKKANRLLKLAGQKVCVELLRMIRRPDYTTISRENEGEESTWFRSKFKGWDEIVSYNIF